MLQLAMKIFLNKYYDNSIPKFIKLVSIKVLNMVIIEELLKFINGENLFYYDVNSLYPFSSLNDMIGLFCNKIIYYVNYPNIEDLFGFFYCKIETPLFRVIAC